MEYKTESATVVFIDLAEFSAIADVYGDETAVALLGLFESVAKCGPRAISVSE